MSPLESIVALSSTQTPPFTMKQLRTACAHCFPVHALFFAYVLPLALRGMTEKACASLLHRGAEAIKDAPLYKEEFMKLENAILDQKLKHNL